VFGLCSLSDLPFAAQLRRDAEHEAGAQAGNKETTVENVAEGAERMDAA
jgi:hypothetical protein